MKYPRSPSFRIAMRMFLIYAMVFGGIVILLLLASVYFVSSVPSETDLTADNVWKIQNVTLTREFIKDFLEPLGAPIALVFGVAISISGAFAAIFLASLASDLQRQQFELEVRGSLDKEFSEVKRLLTNVKLSLSHLRDFVVKRDMIIHRELSTNADSTVTLRSLYKVVKEEKLESELLHVITNLSDSMLLLEQCAFANTLKANIFSQRKAYFEALIEEETSKICESLQQQFTNQNTKFHPEIMTFSGTLEPNESVSLLLSEKLKACTSDSYQPFFSDAKNNISAENIVSSFIIGYGIVPGRDGTIQFLGADFYSRNISLGISSLFGTSIRDALLITGENQDYYETDHTTILINTGSLEFLRLLISISWNISEGNFIDDVSKSYLLNILPDNSLVGERMQNYLNQEIYQLKSVSHEVIDIHKYCSQFKIPLLKVHTFSSEGGQTQATFLEDKAVNIPNIFSWN